MDNELKHYNHNHGKDGRFTFSYNPKISGNYGLIPIGTKMSEKSFFDKKIPFINKKIKIYNNYEKTNNIKIHKRLLKDFTINKGSIVWRYSSVKEKMRDGPTYIIDNKKDVDTYKKYIYSLDSVSPSKYFHEYKVKKDIKIPSYLKQIEVFEKKIWNNKTNKSIFIEAYNNISNNKLKISNDRYLGKTFNDFSYLILLPEKQQTTFSRYLRKEYFNTMKEYGYDGIIDSNDAGYFADSPIYLFNGKQYLYSKPKIENIRKGVENKEMDRIKELGLLDNDVTNEIKHFNPNHGKDGKFTFGSGGSKSLVKLANKKLKNVDKEYKGPFKDARKKADKKRNTKIRIARAKISSMKKKMDERSAEHVKKEIREAIIEGNAKKVMKNYRSMTTDELQEAKKRISLINDLNKISKDSDKSFIKKLLNTDTKKVGGFLDLANKGMDTYGKYSKFKKELADANTSNKVQNVIEKYKDVELSDDGYIPKHMKSDKK